MKSTAPWAFYRAPPYNAISALELMATAVGLQVFGVPSSQDAGAHGYGAVVLSTGTDSQVAARVIEKGIARTYPMCCVAMEIAALQERHNIWLHSRWTPREWNTEADDLTNEKFEAFECGHRIPVRVEDLPWLVLPKLLATGLAWQTQRQPRRPRQEGTARGARRVPLKERDPW